MKHYGSALKRLLSICVFTKLKSRNGNDLCIHINPSFTEKSIQAELNVIWGISKGK